MKQMSNLIKKTVSIAFIFLFVNTIFAGNPQRSGQAGASELLINPWARSSGWAGANVAGVRGLEGIYSNVAGLAFVEELVAADKTFVVFEDADLDSAVEGVVDAIWFNQGQVCCAGSRLLVQESVEKIFIKK